MIGHSFLSFNNESKQSNSRSSDEWNTSLGLHQIGNDEQLTFRNLDRLMGFPVEGYHHGVVLVSARHYWQQTKSDETLFEFVGRELE